jgi:H+-transporting ATPase
MAEVEKKLGSSPDGLTQAEAQKRLKQYGPNEIEEKKTNPLLKFLSYFWGPIPWMIEAAVCCRRSPGTGRIFHHPRSA